MKLIVIPIMFLLLVYTISAVNNEQQYNITSVDFCVGEIIIKVELVENISSLQYSFLDCSEFKERFWKCGCQNPTSLVLLYDEEMDENEFDFIIEYHVEELLPSDGNKTQPGENDIHNEATRRTLEITNIKINKGGPKFKFPEFVAGSTAMIFISIGVVLLVIIFLIVIVVIWIMRSDENKIDKRIEHKSKIIDVELNDKNVDEFLENIFK